MNYSPIIVPVVALVIWSQLMMVALLITVFPRFSARYPVIPGTPLLTSDEEHALQAMIEQSGWPKQFHPLLFCAICFALAAMGAGSGLGSWLAWIYAANWALYTLPRVSQNKFVREGTWVVAHLTVCALAIYAAARVARDML